MNLKDFYNFLFSSKQTLFLEYNVNFSPRYGHGKPPHSLLYNIIDSKREQYVKLLNKTLTYIKNIATIKQTEQSNSLNPYFNNGFLPALDIIVLYSMLSELNPSTYIEVGSGHSTRVAYKAKKEQNLSVKIISIDPKPRTEIDHLSNTIIRQPFEDIDLDIVLSLHEGDILFIDNSHRVLPNSDATTFFMDVLPFLKKGVIVHIHDVYLPYDYPQFMCNRFYSEQYALACFLLANPHKYQTLLPNYFISQDLILNNIISPFWQLPSLIEAERHGGSFWLTISD